MSTTVSGLLTCPLCEGSLLAPRRGSRPAEKHAVPFRTRGGGEGILLCDECAVLAALPANLSFN